MDGQPRIIDLVPRGYGAIILVFLAGLTAIVGLEALYAWMPALSKASRDGHVAAFDLDSEGSLAAWYSSFLYLAAAGYALITFMVRRKKPDDYHGRYRVWAWAAAVWTVMSIDESGSLHEGFKELMSLATGTRIYGDGSVWWVMGYGPVLSYVGLRLFFDMRACWSSTACLFLTAASLGVAVLAQLEIILPQSGARGVMLEEGCELAGTLFLVMGMMLHARYVVLQAEGAIGRPAAAGRTKAKASESMAEPARSGAGDSAPSKTSVAAPASQGRESSTSAAPEQGANRLRKETPSGTSLRIDRPESGHDAHHLSKAERRALRKQQQRRLG